MVDQVVFVLPAFTMCFRFVCEACRQTLPYFCGPPFANALNDVPKLCRVNAHTQQKDFKCTNCERLDGVTRTLESWLRFHPEQRVVSTGIETISTSSPLIVRERIDPRDPRSPFYMPSISITNLRKALAAAGLSNNYIEDRIEDERNRRQDVKAEDEVEVVASHKHDHCCFCLDNFSSRTQESSVYPIQPQGGPSSHEARKSRKPLRSE